VKLAAALSFDGRMRVHAFGVTARCGDGRDRLACGDL